MKEKILLLFSLVFINISLCSSQTNILLFAEDQTTWSIGVFGMNPLVPDSVYCIKIDGQVFIDNNWYFQIKSAAYLFDVFEDWVLNCYVRVSEDSLLYLRTVEGEEKKIFNYKLQDGESEECWSYDCFDHEFVSINPIVEEVGVFNNCGFTYKRWKLANNLGDEWPFTTWITKIGCLEGVLKANTNLNPVTGRVDIVLCAWLDGLQIYSNEIFDNCGFVGKNQLNYKDLSIYPNPTNCDIRIVNLPDEQLLIELYDFMGRVVKTGSYFGKNTVLWDVENLTNGIYILKICDLHNSHIYSEKIIKY